MNARKKCERPPVVASKKGQGLECSFIVYLVELNLITLMRVQMSAGRKDDPTTYTAAFLLDNERVRGVDYNPIARKKRYKETIPKGWHQNIIDPNLPSSDDNQNKHDPLPDWKVADFDDFLRKVCDLWYIDAGLERRLL